MLVFRYSDKNRASIAKYAGQHGVTRAAGYFSKKLEVNISTSTVQYIRLAYDREKKEKRARNEGDAITMLPCKKRGRHLFVGEIIDSQVQQYLQKFREGGGVVTARIAVAAARGILVACDRSKLAEFGGHIHLSPSCGYSLLGRMNFVKRKATTTKSKLSLERFSELKLQFLNDVVSIVELEKIPAELTL